MKNDENESEKHDHSYTDEHTIDLSELEKRLETDFETGLSQEEAERRLEENGPNELTPPKQTPEILKFLYILFNGFAALLWFAGIACFVAYGIEAATESDPAQDNLYLGGALILCVVISGVFSYYQERKSGKIMESFEKMVPPKATVIRDSTSKKLDASDVVVGDLVLIEGGDRIPADIRIISAKSLKVDNSSLTGESSAVSIRPDAADENIMETRNVVFFSTNVMEGDGKGVVVKTGDHTMIGTIAGLVAGLNNLETPLHKEIHIFIRIITTIAVTLGLTFGIIAFSMGYTWIKSLIFLIGIIVANVPEGLLITVTVSLALTAKRMAKKNCLVKNLEGVETLGSTSVICSDKTGTLTQNKMTLKNVWLNLELVKVHLEKKKEEVGESAKESWEALSRIVCLCSRAEFLKEDLDKPVLERKVKGDASEAALLKWYELMNQNSEDVRESNPKVAEIPFNSTIKFQASVHDVDKKGKYIVVLKGAPEIVTSKCSTILVNGEDLEIDDDVKNKFTEAYKQMATLGERVLGFCDLMLDPKKYPPGFKFDKDGEVELPTKGLRFIGLMGMIDPPKPTVPEAVAKCRSAGIKVVMVTGDHPFTAEAIAKQVGIISKDQEVLRYETKSTPPSKSSRTSAVISGAVLSEFSDAMLDQTLTNHWEIVFARTSPQQKLRIVEAFQKQGYVVAVTGDGVNDSPALKKGDIGISMGISGSEVSKEASDMILLDDDFATIVTGVEEGRLIFDNLKKSIVYTLTSNIPEIIPFLSWVTLNIPLPLSTILILGIDLGTDMFPAISLAYESAENDIMSRPPRNAQYDRLVNHRLIFLAYGCIGMTQAAAGFFIYLVILAEHGWFPDRLLGIRKQWVDPSVNNLEDSFGQQWSYPARLKLEQTCQTAYFLAIVQVQWADLIVSKTRIASIFTKKMTNNVLNFALLFETALAVIFIYTPTVPQYIGLQPLEPQWWVPAIPFSIFIFVVDEIRRLILRRWQDNIFGKIIYQETYY